jgi:hypothetical protein
MATVLSCCICLLWEIVSKFNTWLIPSKGWSLLLHKWCSITLAVSSSSVVLQLLSGLGFCTLAVYERLFSYNLKPVITTPHDHGFQCEISGSHSHKYKDGCLLGHLPRSLVDTDQLKLLWNVSQYPPDYTIYHPRRQPSSWLTIFN